MAQPKRNSDSRKDVQTNRLATMNAQLERHGLPVLTRTGTYQNAETEMVSINSVSQNDFYAIVEFETIFPDGKHRPFYIQFSNDTDAQLPCVIIPVINGTHLVFTHQHRPTMLVRHRSWITEFPRGFVITGNQPTLLDKKLMDKLPEGLKNQPGIHTTIGVSGRKLVTLFLHEEIRVTGLRPLNLLPEDEGLPREAAIAENTGMSVDADFYWLLEMETPNLPRVMDDVRGPKQMQIRFIPWQDAIRNRRRHDIIDHTTIAGLELFLEATDRIKW